MLQVVDLYCAQFTSKLFIIVFKLVQLVKFKSALIKGKLE